MTTRIPWKKLERWASLSLKNSIEILSDAVTLYNHGRSNTAFYLAVIALEEFGKWVYLDEHLFQRRASGAIPPDEEINYLEYLYNHKLKQRQFLRYYFTDLDKKTHDWIETGDLEKLKQNSLYVGFERKKKNPDIDSKIKTPFRISKKNTEKIITLVNDSLILQCEDIFSGQYDFYVSNVGLYVSKKDLARLKRMWGLRGPIYNKNRK